MASILFFPNLDTAVCTCGHGHDAHEHFRRGSDCGACGAKICPKFKRDKQRTEALPWNVIALPKS